jgi:hypothetical protein
VTQNHPLQAGRETSFEGGKGGQARTAGLHGSLPAMNGQHDSKPEACTMSTAGTVPTSPSEMPAEHREQYNAMSAIVRRLMEVWASMHGEHADASLWYGQSLDVSLALAQLEIAKLYNMGGGDRMLATLNLVHAMLSYTLGGLHLASAVPAADKGRAALAMHQVSLSVECAATCRKDLQEFDDAVLAEFGAGDKTAILQLLAAIERQGVSTARNLYGGRGTKCS